MSNEGDIHGNGDDVADNEQRIKISNAILPYLEHLYKLLLDPPYVRAASNIFLYKIFYFLNCIRRYVYYDYPRIDIINRIVYFVLYFKNH